MQVTGHLDLNPPIWHMMGHGDLTRAVAKCVVNGSTVHLKNLRVLDVGCGRGELMALLRNAGVQHVEGLDADESCVEIASAHGPCTLGKAEDLCKLFPDQSFDVVVCVSVLEHLRDPLAAVWMMRRIAARRLVLGVPNPYKTACILRTLLLRPRPPHDYHIYSWDAGHFKNFLERFCGLRVVRWGRTRVAVFPYGELRSLPAWILKTAHGVLSPLENVILPAVVPFFGCSLLAVCERLEKWEPPAWILNRGESVQK